MILIPIWILALLILIFLLYLVFDRVWATLDNYLRAITTNPKPARPIGFN
jgi:hypothetical protein